MTLSQDYHKVAADCARLARIAPSPEARAGFAAAAKSWLMLARMVDENPMSPDHASALRRPAANAHNTPKKAAWASARFA